MLEDAGVGRTLLPISRRASIFRAWRIPVTPTELMTIREALADGRSVNPVTVREFLSWFGAHRRGVSIVARIRDVLEAESLATVPDLEEPWLDGLLAFHLVGVVAGTGHAAGAATAKAVSTTEQPPEIVELDGVWQHREAGYRLSRFAAANKPVMSVGPDTTLHEVVTIMLLNDFSQLPVMVGERDVKGVVTWAEIAARAVLGKLGSRASDCMVDPVILNDTASIFEAIQTVVVKDFVLVRDKQRRIAGIVTAADLSLQFRSLSEPFLLLSEIETHVRNMIGETFTLQVLAGARDPGSTREIHSVADLTFGEYVFLLQKEENWTRLGVKLDRQAFCRQLDCVRNIRNQVMHFDPDGLEGTDLQILQEFSSFLKRLEGISS